VRLLKTLREMSDRQLTALARSLIPGTVGESATRGDVDEIAAPLLAEGSGGFGTDGEGELGDRALRNRADLPRSATNRIRDSS
jgi:hypothetical protein